ncbi:MAG: peptidoglycan-binding domain-containing protein [Patescibacteria group bacterium]
MKNNIIIIAGIAVLMSLFSVGSTAHALSPLPDFERRMCVGIDSNLTVGSRDKVPTGYVFRLQQYLQSAGFLNVNPTGYFGSLTKEAVRKFQQSNGVSATGYFGPLTRAKLKAVSCTDDMPTPPVVSKDFSISATTDKSVYVSGEPIVVTITAKNMASTPKNMEFTNGCETALKIGDYDQVPVRLCILMLSTKTFAAGESKTWTVTLPKEEYQVPVGTHILEASITGYGAAKVPLTVVASQTSLMVTYPKGGETWKMGTTQKVTWMMSNATPYSRVDIKIRPAIVCITTPCEAEPVLSIKNAPFDIANPFYTINLNQGANKDAIFSPGNYTAEVCITGTTICAKSASHFTVVE